MHWVGVRVLAGVVVLVLLAGGTGRLEAKSTGALHSSKGLTTVRIGYIPVSSFLSVYVALERGYFFKQHINLQMTQVQNGADIIAAMQGGSLDVGQTNPLSAILARSHGIKLTMITHGIFEVRSAPATSVLVQGNSSIKTAKDLEGKTVAVNQLNNGTQVAAEQWMQRHGGDPSKVHFTELALPQELPSLLHGQIDAAIVGEPFTTIGKSMGARVLVYQYTALRKKTVLGGIVALQPWAAAHKNLVQRFAKAVNEGEAWTHKHPALARAYLTKYVNMDPSVAAKIPLDILDKLRPADLSYWVRLGLNWHVLTTGINVKQLIWPTAAT